MSARALITGGAGFIAVHLARLLVKRGWSVDLLDNLSRGRRDDELASLLSGPRARLIEASMTAPDVVDACRTDYAVIFHFAAIIGVRHVLQRPFDVLRDNVVMTVNVIDIARKQTALDRFVFASTSEVTAGSLIHLNSPVPTPETIPLALTNLADPRTSYMLSKIYGEALCHHAGLPFTIVRPHNVYGPRMGMAHVIPELLRRAYTAAPDIIALEVASIAHKRAFCFVDDAVEQIFALSLAQSALNGTFNVGNDGAEISIGKLARIVIDTVGRPDLEISALPPTPGSPERRCPDLARTRGVTGFTPSIDTEQGVKRTFDWYRRQGFEFQEEAR